MSENKKIKDAAILGASSEVVQKYGSAAKEYFVSYSGVDNETGQILSKSLKSINEQKVNPDYIEQNIKQQSGFSAEVLETANTNSENKIKGSPERKVRSDDLGKVNDPLYDHMKVDAKGKVIPGSGSQMKFVGNTPEESFKKLMSKDFDKYLENDVKMEIPSDYYQKVLDLADDEIEKLQEQLEALRLKGDTEHIKKIQKQINKCKKLKKNLRKSSVSSKEAKQARLNPKLTTAKHVVKVSHRAGVKSAGISAIVGGVISSTQNIYACCKGDISTEECAVAVVKDTAGSAVTGYITGFGGTALKGMMQNAKSTYLQSLSKTNLPSAIVMVVVDTGKTLKRYLNNEISGLQCFEDLGEQGVGMISAAVFGAVGQIAIPIPVVGEIIGSMVGYALSSACYGTLLGALKDARIAKEERIRIEKECEENIRLIKAYRADMEETIRKYMYQRADLFHKSFSEMKNALQIGDVDGYISSVNLITEKLEKKTIIKNVNELELIMSNNELPIKL